MRIIGIIVFLMFIVLPTSLFAQGGGTTTSSNSGLSADFGDTFQGVTNLSEQGGFIGSGRPEYFVGFDEIYGGSTASSRSRTASTARATTTTRPRTVTATAQRGVRTAAGTAQLGNLNNQTVRAATSLDVDIVISAARRQLPPIESYLARLQGLHNNQISYADSPQGTTAVITGTVTSDRERRVAKELLLLQPGIDRVENRIEIR